MQVLAVLAPVRMLLLIRKTLSVNPVSVIQDVQANMILDAKWKINYIAVYN